VNTVRALLRARGDEGATNVRGPAAAGAAPSWLDREGWRICARTGAASEAGRHFATFRAADGSMVDAVTTDAATVLPFDPDEAYETYVSERWRESVPQKALPPGVLELFYRVKRMIPRRVQLAARRPLLRWQASPSFPRWPLDRSVDRLLRFYAASLAAASGARTLEFAWFWPDAARAAVALTHDVESAEGLRLAVDLADLEEERGLRSSFNVVGRWYAIDHGILDELRSRGFEIGLHGIYHDRSMFGTRAGFERQQADVRAKLDEFGAVGFRSPATHRVYEWLGELPVLYDCTIPHSDPYEPVPGGCCSFWPFFVGDVVELPYTMPQDHLLFTLLGNRHIDVWLRQVEELVAGYGLIQVVTHPDPGYLGDPPKRRLYVELLDALVDRRDVWQALPRDVADWWLARSGRASAQPWTVENGTVDVEGADASFNPPVRGAA
jgi:hypothetical protein